MKVYSDVADLRAHLRCPVATIGNFDGVHRGHRAIIERVLRRAADLGGESLLITFEPHPLAVLAPDRAPRMITTRRQKLALLEEAGLDFVLILPFTMELASVEAESFVRDYLATGLAPREIYVGANFNFGRARAGNADLLVTICADLGIQGEKVPEVRSLGSPISSSRIRRAVLSGEVELARDLLGRPYALEGTVVHGAGRGAGLGFPTANLTTLSDLVPQDGVYVTEALIDAVPRPSVTNIGTRPTFGNSDRALETHLFDSPGDIYGRPVELRFHGRLRTEIKFDSPEALAEQVRRDIARAREFFRTQPEPGRR